MKISKKHIIKLLKNAANASSNAYAPYSNYYVGAAILTKNGKIYTGCNVENASYGLTVCAERAAVQNAVSHGEKEFVAIAIVADGTPSTPVPCGACRQVLAEFCKPSMPIFTAHKSCLNQHTSYKLGTLLPDVFKLKHRL